MKNDQFIVKKMIIIFIRLQGKKMFIVRHSGYTSTKSLCVCFKKVPSLLGDLRSYPNLYLKLKGGKRKKYSLLSKSILWSNKNKLLTLFKTRKTKTNYPIFL